MHVTAACMKNAIAAERLHERTSKIKESSAAGSSLLSRCTRTRSDSSGAWPSHARLQLVRQRPACCHMGLMLRNMHTTIAVMPQKQG